MPEQCRHLAGGGDDRDLVAAAPAGAFVEGLQRSGCSDGGQGGLDEHVADLGGAFLADAAGVRGAGARLTDPRVKTEVADQPARVGEAADVADGGQEHGRGDHPNAGDGSGRRPGCR